MVAFGYIRWNWVIALILTMGLLNGVHYRTLLIDPIIGVFLCILLWFTTRPSVWWYDFVYFGILLACTFVAWLISIAVCQILQLAIHITVDCQAVTNPNRFIGMVVFVLIPNIILYVTTYVNFIFNVFSGKGKA